MTREEALEELKEIRFNLNYKVNGTSRFDEALDMAIKALSSSEKPNKWIPCSERLPEDHKDVLICLSSDQICIGCYNSHRLPFSNNVIGWGANYAHNWCSKDVLAWMPLPLPYQPEIPTGSEGSDKE